MVDRLSRNLDRKGKKGNEGREGPEGIEVSMHLTSRGNSK
jgi:hypothetical protein